MKIDTDLRMAVRSAIKAQPRDTWSARCERDKKAIEKLLATNADIRGKVRRALRIIKRAELAQRASYKTLGELGLSSDAEQVTDKARFKAAGGVIKEPPEPLDYDALMLKLLQATPAEARKLLKEFNINWEPAK